MQRADRVRCARPFPMRDLSFPGFWYPQGFWNRSPWTLGVTVKFWQRPQLHVDFQLCGGVGFWRPNPCLFRVLCIYVLCSCCQAVLCIILHFLSQGLCSPDSFEDNVTVTKKCYNCQPDQQFSLSCSCSKSIITEFS